MNIHCGEGSGNLPEVGGWAELEVGRRGNDGLEGEERGSAPAVMEMTPMTIQALAPRQELATSRDIPLSKLVRSDANVRKVKSGISVDELAQDIARRGLLQSISVRPVLDVAGAETGTYAVSAGGRRFAALRTLVEEGRLPADTPVPCLIKSDGIEVEDSLAENVMRAGLHPLDQFRAFKSLSDQEGLTIEEIATRFFVSPQIVRQRLKLASASLVLLSAYAEDEINLDQLMAFCVSGDHARQEAVWEQIRHSYNKEPYAIRRLLTEGAVKGNDRRVLFVGADTYDSAGGIIDRDLFAEDGGGWFSDVALLDRLASEKLAACAQQIEAEGWKWVETAVSFPYGHLNGLMRLTSEPVPVSDDEQAAYDAALVEYNALSQEYESAEELPEDIDRRMGELEGIMAAIEDRPATFVATELPHAGVFISIDHDGRLRVERGFVRPEDRAALNAMRSGASSGSSDGEETSEGGRAVPDDRCPAAAEEAEVEAEAKLSDRLTAELTAWRTLALREKLAEDPDTALLTVTHALALKTFYRFAGPDSCLEIDLRSANLDAQAMDLGESPLAARMNARQSRWAELLPKSPHELWEVLVAYDADSLAALFAFCASQSLNALELPHVRRTRELAHADALADLVDLDMRTHWQPTAKGYFSKVTKAQILATIREVKGESAAQMIDHLKKADMAIEAERLIAGSGWLPQPLKGTREAAPLRVSRSANDFGQFDAPQVDVDGSQYDETQEAILPAFLTEGLHSSADYTIAAE